MITHIRRAIVLSLFCLVFFGLVYPLVGTGVSQVLFKHQANGSLTANGSSMIGQNWTSPKFFHGRPDDTGQYKGTGDNPLMANGKAGEWAPPTSARGPRRCSRTPGVDRLLAQHGRQSDARTW